MTSSEKRKEVSIKHFKQKLVFAFFTGRPISCASLWIKYCCVSKNTTLGIELIYLLLYKFFELKLL